ncbi:28S ribosomal protein S18b, mitochondrial [Exaiptasia diaphana]|uniref:Small ribosomal subunit protein mS40 n=1 Tax=Exaiptasia diaphana TaxID=2652724 RepID=A0A913Y832_EXADI|nr:28S ribosomal protein S18b, mitochondrial [Exaiptasia diaphana]KXJ19675.1 28S ribosomal protein S18b, mitochondrial [Exaiptasia diaphana]
MAAGSIRNCFSVVRSVLPGSAVILDNFLTQRISLSHIVLRNYSRFSEFQGIKPSADRGKFLTLTYPYSLSNVRFVHNSGSQHEFNEADTYIPEHTSDLKKLTIDDIMKEWQDSKPIWSGYRRNHKGQIPQKRTRLRCTTVSKKLLTQNPCPICRVRVNKNYEMDSKDVVFLTQFISPHSGEVLDNNKTGVCRQQQKKLIKSIEEAKNQGNLPFTIPGPRDPQRQFKAAGIPAPNIRNKTG